uniref:MATE family efflux transporter n=1 Tax=Faecalibaculum rodentium TaxID=1702221 RepID=UPI003F66CA9C
MHKLESMDIRHLVISMSVPIALSMLLSALYNIIDSMFVAGYSQEALLSVSLCYPIQTLMIAIACGIGVGFNTVLARYLGEQKPEMASQSVLNGMLLALISWLLFLAFGFLGSRWFLGLFTREAEVIAQGDAYLKICCGFSFAIFFQITFERIMQATGRPMYNLAIQGTGALINIILDPVFIFTFNLGVAGAAIATVIGQVTAMGLGIWITYRKVPEIHMDIRKFRWDGPLMLRILQIGIPAMVMQAVMSFMSVFMNWILMPFSAMAVSVFSVYIKLQQFVFMIVMGFTNALIPIVSFNFGPGSPLLADDGHGDHAGRNHPVSADPRAAAGVVQRQSGHVCHWHSVSAHHFPQFCLCGCVHDPVFCLPSPGSSRDESWHHPASAAGIADPDDGDPGSSVWTGCRVERVRGHGSDLRHSLDPGVGQSEKAGGSAAGIAVQAIDDEHEKRRLGMAPFALFKSYFHAFSQRTCDF